MAWWEKRVVLRVLATILAVAAVGWLALWYFVPAPPSSITIAAGIKNGPFRRFAENYQRRLARHHIKLNIRFVRTETDHLKLLADRKSGVDAAFLYGGSSNSKQSPNLVSLGRINNAPIWVFYRAPEQIDRLSQIRGKRINVHPAIYELVSGVLAAYNVTADNSKISSVTGVGRNESLKKGDLDVIFLPPQQLDSPFVQSLVHDPSIQLMNLPQAETLTRLFPSLNRLVLSQGLVDLDKNIPPNDVNLIATTNVVVVHKDLHPELIYLLAETLQEEHSGAGVFQRAGEFPTANDPEFEVAEEARDYYRNGPSFLHRYLPFWIVNLTKRAVAVLVTAFAIVIPLMTYAPKLYQWLLHGYLQKLYRRLRAIERAMRTELSARQVEALQTDLENINRAASLLPMRHSDAFFNLIIHIRLTRAELVSRLTALHA